MKNLDKLYLAYAKMGAEIEKLEAEPKGVWKPYRHEKNRWEVVSVMLTDSRPAYVLSEEIAQSICDMFNEEGEA